MLDDELWTAKVRMKNGDITIDEKKTDELHAFWADIKEGYNKQEHIMTLKNGSRIFLRSADNPDNLRGPNMGWFAIDEAAMLPEYVWRILIGRIRNAPSRGWLATTPRGMNWVWERFAKKKNNKYNYFTGSTFENIHNPTDYGEDLADQFTGMFYEQEVLGRFTTWEGLVYSTLQLDLHNLAGGNGLGNNRYGIAGVDFGWRDPSVIVVGLVGDDQRIHIVDEFYKTKVTIEDLVDKAVELKLKWGIETLYCDSSRPEFIHELRNRGRLDARKGYKDIIPGISAVSRMLQGPKNAEGVITEQPRLKIDFAACPNTIREMRTYHYAEDIAGKPMKDKPLDMDNHAMDALRYMCYSHSRRGYVGSVKGNR